MTRSKAPKGRSYKVLHAANVPRDLLRAFTARMKVDGITCRDACIQLMRRVVSKDITIEKEVMIEPEGEKATLYVKRVPEQLHNSFDSMVTLYGMRIRWAVIQLMRKVVAGNVTVKKEY